MSRRGQPEEPRPFFHVPIPAPVVAMPANPSNRRILVGCEAEHFTSALAVALRLLSPGARDEEILPAVTEWLDDENDERDAEEVALSAQRVIDEETPASQLDPDSFALVEELRDVLSDEGATEQAAHLVAVLKGYL